MSTNNDKPSLSIENTPIDAVTDAKVDVNVNPIQLEHNSRVQKDADAERASGINAPDDSASSRQTPNEANAGNNHRDANTTSDAAAQGKVDWDLSVEADVIRYLSSTPFACTTVESLSGGTANFVYRLTLVQPYNGHATLVLKHAKGFVKNSPTFAFDIARQKFEVGALRHVFAWVPKDSLVRVPEVHLFDEEVNVVIMDDTGHGSINLKEFLQKGHASPGVAEVIGRELGGFLAGLHSWGKGDEAVRQAVVDNEQGKAIKASYYYGGLKPTLEGKFGVPFLTDPTLDIREEDMKIVEQVTTQGMKAIQESKGAFVMGDFWPGNIMIRVEDGRLKQIMVIDWELAKEGVPGIDVGQFSAELHLLRRCNPETCQETATLVLDNFLKKYKEQYGPSVEDAKWAVGHVGAHMIVLGARVDWGPKEITREVVLEGVGILVSGYLCKTEEDLRSTVIGGMI